MVEKPQGKHFCSHLILANGFLYMLRESIVVVFLLLIGQATGFGKDQYGEWSVEKLNRNSTALLNRDMRLMDDRVSAAEIGFTCNRQSKTVNVSLIPFEGSYKNQQHDVPVLVQKSADNATSSDLAQKWRNGFKYLFLSEQDEIDKLISYFKANERDRIDFVYFFFSGDFNGKADAPNHVAISLAGFSEGLSALNSTCKRKR